MKHLVLGLALGMGIAGAALADPVDGTWKTAEGEEGGHLHVAIGACGSAICGTIQKAFDANGAPSGDYEHLGKRIIWDMTPEGNGTYGGGKIWAPDADKTYKSKMELSGNSLEVKGCVAGGLICRGQVWTRVK